MRADRLLSILLLLQVHRRLTSRELAKRLEVSDRTIHRDMDALSASGVPVTADRGNGGGWSLLEDYQTKLTGLSHLEIQALFLARPTKLLSDLGLRQAAEGGMVKLLASIPEAARKDAEYARQRFLIDTSGWRAADEDVAWLAPLQEAVWQERKARMIYARDGREPAERVIDPLGLVSKGPAWYLVAAVEDSIRTYRISRVQGVELLEERSKRPAGFDLAEYWAHSSAQFQEQWSRYDVTLRVSPDLLPYMRFSGRWAKARIIGDPDRAGWVTACVRFDCIEEACHFALGYGAQMEVLEPAELRGRVIAEAKRMVESYTSLSVVNSNSGGCSMSASPIPKGFHSLTPAITVSDGAKAMEFYKQAFGAESVTVLRMPDGKIGHAEMRIGDSIVMLSDEFPEMGVVAPQGATNSSGILLYTENADAVFDRAIAAGATALTAVSDMFWGDRYGQLRDPFGHKWSVATHMKDLTEAEILQAAQAAMGATAPVS